GIEDQDEDDGDETGDADQRRVESPRLALVELVEAGDLLPQPLLGGRRAHCPAFLSGRGRGVEFIPVAKAMPLLAKKRSWVSREAPLPPEPFPPHDVTAPHRPDFGLKGSGPLASSGARISGVTHAQHHLHRRPGRDRSLHPIPGRPALTPQLTRRTR